MRTPFQSSTLFAACFLPATVALFSACADDGLNFMPLDDLQQQADLRARLASQGDEKDERHKEEDGRDDAPNINDPALAGLVVDFLPQLSGSNSPSAINTNVLLPNAEVLAAFLGNQSMSQEERDRLAAIDWQNKMVLAVTGDDRPTGGYGLRADAVVRFPDQRLVVRLTTRGPACGTIVTPSLTRPYTLLLLPRFVPRTLEAQHTLDMPICS